MTTVGFINLPSWAVELRQLLLAQGFVELARAPVLGAEDVERPWAALPPDEFFACVETSLHFPNESSRIIGERWTPQVITADTSLACNRFLQNEKETTGVRGAIGGTFPLLDLYQPEAGYPAVQRLLAAPDGIAVAALAEMERTGHTLDQSLQEIQWRNLWNYLSHVELIKHIHGLVARDRVVLLASLIFNIKIDPTKVPCEGFNHITPRDIELAQHLDMTIRLLAVAEVVDSALSIWVGPVLMPARYLLAQIRSGSEGAYLQLADRSSIFFCGTATSPAVIVRGMIRDWLEISQRQSMLIPKKSKSQAAEAKVSFVPEKTAPSHFYLRFAISNFELTAAQVLNALTLHGIGIRSIFQPPSEPSPVTDQELVVFTQLVNEKHLQDVLREIRNQIRLATLKTCLRTEG